MTSLTTPFPILSQLKTSLLLVEVTPFDVLIGVLNPSESALSYDSISPLPFLSLEDLIQNFFDLHNFLNLPEIALIAFPLNFLEHGKNSSPPSPPFSWTFAQEEVQKRFSFSQVFVCDRGSAIAKAIPFLSPSDIQLFSNELPGYFSEPQSTCFLVNIDCGFEEVSLIPMKEGSLRIWKSFRNLGGALRLETDISYVQHLIDVMRHEYTSPYPTVSDFFENLGIERLYQTLYIDKGMEAYFRRKIFEAPRVIDPGAVPDIDPLEINNPPRMSLEGMDISIASIEPRRIKRVQTNASTENFLAQKLPSNLEEGIDWTLIRSLTVFQILKGAFDFQGLKSSMFAQFSSVHNLSLPPEIQKLCFETLDMWSSLLGKTIGRHSLILNAIGGAYLSGRLLYLLKDLFKNLSFVQSFEKESLTHPTFKNTPFFLVTHATPAFLGMVQLFLEREKD